MSRSNYIYDCEYLDLYRANLDRAIGGKRGQKFLRELAAALDVMPEKRLIGSELISDTGEVCAIGAVAKVRGLDISEIDDSEPDSVGRAVGIASCMAAEIAFLNDEMYPGITPEQRWERMREWVDDQLIKEKV